MKTLFPICALLLASACGAMSGSTVDSTSSGQMATRANTDAVELHTSQVCVARSPLDNANTYVYTLSVDVDNQGTSSGQYTVYAMASFKDVYGVSIGLSPDGVQLWGPTPIGASSSSHFEQTFEYEAGFYDEWYVAVDAAYNARRTGIVGNANFEVDVPMVDTQNNALPGSISNCRAY